MENCRKGYKEALSKNPHESPEAFSSYGAEKKLWYLDMLISFMAYGMEWPWTF